MAGPRHVPEESAIQVAPEKLVAAMEQEMQRYLESVMQAVNDAPDGAWIAGSEESVRELSAGFRRRVFERAVEMREEVGEAAFSRSAQPGDGQASGE